MSFINSFAAPTYRTKKKKEKRKGERTQKSYSYGSLVKNLKEEFNKILNLFLIFKRINRILTVLHEQVKLNFSKRFKKSFEKLKI